MKGRPKHVLTWSVVTMAESGHSTATIAEALALKPDTVRVILRREGFERSERWERR